MFQTTETFPAAKNTNLPAFDIEVAFTSLPTEGPIWRTIASDVRDLSTVRGRPREFDRFSAGRLNVTLDNNSRDYDPENTTGPLYGHVLPEKRVRVLARYNSVTYVVFDGFVDGWPQEWLDFGKDAKVQLSATDGFKVLAQAELPSSLYEMVVAADKPDHWWKLDEAAGQSVINDSGVSAEPRHGVPLGGPTLGTASFVPYDGGRTCVSTDGSNDSIEMDYQLNESTTYTVSWWFTQDADMANFWGMGGLESGGTSEFPRLAVRQLSDVLLVQYQDGSLTSVSGSATVGNSTPHLGAVTFSGTTLSILVDGVLDNTGSDTSVPLRGAALRIGRGLASNSYSALIGIAHLAAWEGRALTAAELLVHYNAGKNGLTGEATGTRVTRILNHIGWPSADRDIDTGSSTVGAHDLSGGSALDYLQTLHDTEQGQMYMGLDGALSSDGVFKFVWRQRHALITSSRSATSQATFSDAGSLRYADLELSYDETKVFNEARVNRQDGAEQTATDTASQGKYFKRSYEKSGLLYASDNDSFDHATWAKNRYKDPRTRVEAIVIKPQDDPANLWPHVLGREIGDRITVTRSGISKEVIIEGIEHDYDGEDWTTTYRCSPADLGPYWVLDDATFSVLDTTTIPAF